MEVVDFRPGMGNDPEPATREQVMDLMKQKDNIEEEIKALHEVLESQKVGMDEPLVDGEGFPRSDIDVYQVRHARHNIRSKGNDLISLVARIEVGLHSLHAQARETCEGGVVANREQDLPTSPFARVMVVLDGSPAETAGIKQGDLVTKFGSVTKENFKNLKNISDVGESSQGRGVEVVVVRGGSTRRLRMVPCSWSGMGLLGFKIRPVGDEENIDR
eukprot:GFUD01034216.1.p1 GENE.GFUD01034216.1~~GFUD01034216.1.p1  ORF type:complete len:217 (+),score=62.64 GFUD01034216.1:40-690(+)